MSRLIAATLLMTALAAPAFACGLTTSSNTKSSTVASQSDTGQPATNATPSSRSRRS